ncbi:hypothetical protein ACJX0J_028601, partial [Zea mays]
KQQDHHPKNQGAHHQHRTPFGTINFITITNIEPVCIISQEEEARNTNMGKNVRMLKSIALNNNIIDSHDYNMLTNKKEEHINCIFIEVSTSVKKTACTSFLHKVVQAFEKYMDLHKIHRSCRDSHVWQTFFRKNNEKKMEGKIIGD